MQKIFFILSISMFFWGCRKDKNCVVKVKRNFEVQGYLISRQDNNPKIGGKITITFTKNNSQFGGCYVHRIAGEGYSDSTGRFVITCEEYSRPLSGSYNINDSYEIYPPSGETVVNVDTIYTWL